MKILIVGATGTIGSAVSNLLKGRHEVISVGSHSGDFQVDISNEASIQSLFNSVGMCDAIVCTSGSVRFKPLADLTAEDYQFGLNHKLMGQVNLVRIGKNYVSQGGSFTLTSGILNHDPIAASSGAAMVNGALEGFVRAAAMELPNSQRINLVSPTVITESLPKYASVFPGYVSVDAATAAMAYVKSVEGKQTGQVYRVGY